MDREGEAYWDHPPDDRASIDGDAHDSEIEFESLALRNLLATLVVVKEEKQEDKECLMSRCCICDHCTEIDGYRVMKFNKRENGYVCAACTTVIQESLDHPTGKENGEVAILIDELERLIVLEIPGVVSDPDEPRSDLP